MGAEQDSGGDVLSWLETLPLAPEYHPTIQEFQDPISYILKLEEEASKYGICKIVPPVPPQTKKSVIFHFNRSLEQRSTSKQARVPKSQPTFTTRRQQIGFCPKKQRPVQKPVWQSGKHYTFQEFEAKAKTFERNCLKGRPKKAVSALELETRFWKADGDRPISVEYANDVPGSAFGPVKERRWRESGETGVGTGNVSETAWNMRGVARSNGSLLKFMKDEIPGVTSPMVYLAMMFSWFAWHVEDHDLHSLNYLHLGAGKTWYGVPSDAATAFEEVVRVHGYGEEINPLVAFELLSEKTTVMSPEVLSNAGVPCCRLVQNPGEFVVTFPRAYHSGFSHGFNCGEASNIATPEWLRFAKEAAIRRASINYPPMVSHFQLLYDLALAPSSSNPSGMGSAPRSSRLREKKRGRGENLLKQVFVEDVTQNNNFMHTLGKGSPVVLLPLNPSERFICSNYRTQTRYKTRSGLPLHLSGSGETAKTSKRSASNDMPCKGQADKRSEACHSRKGKLTFMDGFEVPASSAKDLENGDDSVVIDGFSDRGLFSCVKCGIWPFACVAIVQPTESTSQYLMSADFSLDDLLGSRELNNGTDVYNLKPNCSSGSVLKNAHKRSYDNSVQSTDRMQMSDDALEKVDGTFEVDSDADIKRLSALGLLALTYGNSSESEEDDSPPHAACNNTLRDGLWGSKYQSDHPVSPCSLQEHARGTAENCGLASLKFEHKDIAPHSTSDSFRDHDFSRVDYDDSGFGSSELAEGFSNKHAYHRTDARGADISEISDPGLPFSLRPDEDSSRTHVFCLEHAMELEQFLRPVGGIHIMLLCRPDYPKVEDAAKLVAEELGMSHCWNDTPFKIACKEDEASVQLALKSEEETPKSGDWAAKLGINLYYSSLLCRSPHYTKQMPCNSVINTAFSFGAPATPTSKESKVRGKRSCRQKKIVMAGNWCGKVWMSNQVHPSLLNQDAVVEESPVGAWFVEKPKTVKKARSTSVTVSRAASKRKSKFQDRSVKKMKMPDSDPDDLPDAKSHQSAANHYNSESEAELEGGPSSRLRKRALKRHEDLEISSSSKRKSRGKKGKEEEYSCDLEGCAMSFGSGAELSLHKRNICPVEGCGKKFFSHKYLVQHRRIHDDVRPLKCPWKGCGMSFKWTWARTEHIRVHTGARPYACKEPGCAQTFRFVSDFSRHKRNTGHSTWKKKKKTT